MDVASSVEPKGEGLVKNDLRNGFSGPKIEFWTHLSVKKSALGNIVFYVKPCRAEGGGVGKKTTSKMQ